MSASASTAPSSSSETGPVYFWHEYDEPYGYLSQWYECAFEHEGNTYLTAEMWMMVQKAVLFGDDKIRDEMLAVTDPHTHKKLGRQVKGFNNKVWDQNKSRIVEEGNLWKFTASKENSELGKLLLATGDRELVEASPVDRIWGIGYAASKAEANRAKWGQNLLGKALMNVRTKLREQESKQEKTSTK